MESLIQQISRKRRSASLEKSASAKAIDAGAFEGAVATLEKCAKVDWGDVARNAVGALAPAAVGVIGGAAVGGLADAVRPKAKDERDRKKRLVRSLLTGAAFGGIAGAGFSAYRHQIGGFNKGNPIRFFDLTPLDAAGRVAVGYGAYDTGLFHRKYLKPGPLQVSVSSSKGVNDLKTLVSAFENGGIDKDQFVKGVYGNPEVSALHGGHAPAINTADAKAVRDVLRRAKFAYRHPGGWSRRVRGKLGWAALIGGAGIIANKYTELFGDK